MKSLQNQIDTRGGYLNMMATEVSDFGKELSQARAQEQELRTAVMSQSQVARMDPVAVLALLTSLLPANVEEERMEDTQAYLTHREGSEGEEWDKLLPLVQS